MSSHQSRLPLATEPMPMKLLLELAARRGLKVATHSTGQLHIIETLDDIDQQDNLNHN